MDQTHSAEAAQAWVTNDAVVAGMLFAILGLVFWTANSQLAVFRQFYRFVPMLLMCYFLPSLLTAFGLVDPDQSRLYFVSSHYLLPACIVLLTLSVDLREILKLGPTALIMFLTGTVGVILGGPLAIVLVSLIDPEVVGGTGPDAVWRGLSTVAGSWIGGAANQAAMREIFGPADELFATMIAVDVLVAEVWMIFVLLGAKQAKAIDRLLRADTTKLDTLQAKMEAYIARQSRIPSATDLMLVAAVAFAVTGLAHAAADALAPWFADHSPALSQLGFSKPFFWLIVLATTGGLLLSFSPVKQLEGAGASKVATVFIFFLVATIGMQMDIRAVGQHSRLFAVGLVWMAIHVALMFLVAYVIRAPFFYLAVGSKANIGGAASAPIVAAAFHPSLAPVGVLLAVLGYVLGTYGAWICGLLMQAAAP